MMNAVYIVVPVLLCGLALWYGARMPHAMWSHPSPVQARRFQRLGIVVVLAAIVAAVSKYAVDRIFGNVIDVPRICGAAATLPGLFVLIVTMARWGPSNRPRG